MTRKGVFSLFQIGRFVLSYGMSSGPCGMLYYEPMTPPTESPACVRLPEGGLCATAALAWPILLGSASMAVLAFVERLLLGRYSESALAASLPGSMLASTFTVVLGSTIGYAGAFVAQFHGAGNGEKAASALFQGLWMTLLATPVFLCLIPLGGRIVRAVGHAPQVQADELTFFVSYVFVGLVSTLAAVLGGFFSGQGRTQLVGVATAVGCLAGLALNPLLIFTCDLGIAGAGIASVAGFAVTSAILGVCAARDPLVRAVAGTKAAAFRPRLAGRILRFGLPLGLAQLVANGTFALFVSVFGRLGATTLALGNACFAVHTLIYYVVCAVAEAAQIQAGRFYGRHDLCSVRHSQRSAALLAIGTVSVFFAAVLPFSRAVLAAFGFMATPDTMALGFAFLALMALRDLLEALQCVYTSGLRGVGDTRFVLLARLGASGFFWTPIFLLAARFAQPVVLWATMPAAFALHAIVLFLRWRSRRWTAVELEA